MYGTGLAGDSFYVWQQAWSSNVADAVTAETPTTLYPLATTVPPTGKSRLVDIPWEQLGDTEHRYIPTIRIPLKAFNRPDLQAELVRVALLLGRFGEIQLDLDCPESRLGEYTRLLQQLRPAIPQGRLSITVLPCHLGNRTFRVLAGATDYYVLQVHGLEIPEHMDGPSALMDTRVAEKAIAQAEALGHPYWVALPCYAYELNYDPATGAFLFLTAEQPGKRQQTAKRRISATAADLIEIIERVEGLGHARGIVWFRLPVEGDRLCLPRTTLAQIQAGIPPTESIQCQAEPISAATMELLLTNGNTICAATATLELQWENPRGAFDLYGQTKAPGHEPGQLPTSLTAPVPPPGQTVKIGWFTASQPPKTHLDLK